MTKSRMTPAWLLILIDLLLIAAILCTFCWFHHIQNLWFGLEEELPDMPAITKPVTKPDPNDPVVEDPGDGYDYSGDFGAKFGQKFLKEGEEIISTPTEYKDNDMWVTLTEVNREMFYEGTGRTYQVQYFVYDIYVRNIENFYTISVDNRQAIADLMDLKSDKTGTLLKDGLPIAAVNGDYWGNKNHTEIAVRNGIILRHSEYITSDICVLYWNGEMETITPAEYSWDKINAKAPYQIWEFGPALLDADGKKITEYSNDSFDHNVVDQRHPRSSIGYYEPGHYVLVSIDGRSDDSEGVRVAQIAQIYEELGCKVAYNFDGGDSCQAYFNGVMYRVDQERDENGEGQRDLYDIVCIGKVKKD